MRDRRDFCGKGLKLRREAKMRHSIENVPARPRSFLTPDRSGSQMIREIPKMMRDRLFFCQHPSRKWQPRSAGNGVLFGTHGTARHAVRITALWQPVQ